MRRYFFSKTILLAFSVLLFIGAYSQSVTAKYPDPSKSIEFIIPVGVGGGYDLYVRMILPYLSKELGVNFRIKNEPGGAWLVGLRDIYRSKADGYTIGIWNPGVLINDKDILGKVDYDMTTFTFLYRVTDEPRAVFIKKDGPIKDFKDLLAKGRSKDFKVRASYSGGTALVDAKLMDSEWGIDTEKIPYKSGSDTRMAVMRGDVHFCVSGLGAASEAISSGRMKVILLFNDKPITQVQEANKLLVDYPELKNVPIPSDLGLKPLSYDSRSARAFIAPPGLPKDIKNVIEKAMERVMKNKELREIAIKADRPLGEGQNGDDYARQMKSDKKVLMKMKSLLKESKK